MRTLRILLVLCAGPFLVHRVVRTALTERAARIAAGALIAVFLAGCALCSWRIVELYPSFNLGG
jgi:hypothetical protein